MPRVVDHEERRRELIQATWTVIATEGLEAVTMRRVAAAADCTTGRITHHFADRDDLLVAALRAAHGAAAARMHTAIATEPDPTRRLRAVLLEALPLDAGSTIEWKVWLAFWSVATTDRRLAREDARRYAEWTALVAGLLTGLVPTRRIETTAARLIALVDGLGIRGAVHPGPATRRAITRALDAALAAL